MRAPRQLTSRRWSGRTRAERAAAATCRSAPAKPHVTVIPAERRPVDLSTTAQDAWLTSELERFRAAGERELARRRRSTPGLTLHFADTRSIEEYGQEVRRYVDAAREHWVDGLSVRAAAHSLAPPTVEVRNDGDRQVSAMVAHVSRFPGVRISSRPSCVHNP
jgi:hypothetical protein